MAGQKTPTMKLWVSAAATFYPLWLNLTGVFVFTAKAQKVEMDKLEKAKKEKTKVSPMKNVKKHKMSMLGLCNGHSSDCPLYC